MESVIIGIRDVEFKTVGTGIVAIVGIADKIGNDICLGKGIIYIQCDSIFKYCAIFRQIRKSINNGVIISVNVRIREMNYQQFPVKRNSFNRSQLQILCHL